MTPPIRIRRVVGPILLMVTVAATAARCPPSSAVSVADDAARTFGSAVHRIEPVDGARYLRLPETVIVIPPEVDDFTNRTRASMAELTAQPVAELTDDEPRTVVKRACELKDWVEIYEQDELLDQAESLLDNYGGNATLKNRVADLATNMSNAEDSGEAAAQAAVFGLCEWA
ncbi:hypothetical protein AB0D29_10820 [Streptomyces sp. NPDC048424]|uniref:hypothetical protein n=1 Tax=Streptomyces sp. NPDC048424 TaxID=3155265 RepID=UPI003413D7D4